MEHTPTKRESESFCYSPGFSSAPLLPSPPVLLPCDGSDFPSTPALMGDASRTYRTPTATALHAPRATDHIAFDLEGHHPPGGEEKPSRLCSAL
jgi:hypothetical protein